MTTFTIANLADVFATFTETISSLSGTLSITQPGCYFINKTVGSATAVQLATALTGIVTVKDAKGDANTNPIAITVAGGLNIDAAASLTLSLPYQWVSLCWNGSSYSVVG